MKHKFISFSIAVLWLMSPLIIYQLNYHLNNLNDYLQTYRLDNTYPSEELVRGSFSGYDNDYVSLTNVILENGVLRLQFDIDEESLKKGVLTLKQETMENEEYVKVHFTSEENKERVLITLSHHHVFKNVYNVHDIRWDINRKTTVPTEIITEVYYKGELFQSIGNMADAMSMEKSKVLYYNLLSEN